MSLPYNGSLIKNARSLRKASTRHEKHLWYDFLNKYPIRFQRQKTIGNFIVDFYCHKAKLIVELDGSQHYMDKAIEDDARRTDILSKNGLKVLRFSNTDIDKNFKGVCETIDICVKDRM